MATRTAIRNPTLRPAEALPATPDESLPGSTGRTAVFVGTPEALQAAADAGNTAAQMRLIEQQTVMMTPAQAGLGITPTPGGAPAMINFSNGFVSSGDFTGSLAGSSGSQGSTYVDLISKGLDIVSAFAKGSTVNQAQAGKLPPIGPGSAPSSLPWPYGTQGPNNILSGPNLRLSASTHGLRAQNRARAAVGLPLLKPRMNPLNPRALRRSMRRVQSFAKFARRTIAFTHRVRMKKGRRR